MKIKLRFLDPIVVIGLVISIALSTLLVVSGQDSATSMLIGLIITAITLLVDVIARIHQTEEKLLSASILGTSVSDDPFLMSLIQRIVDDYNKIKNHETRTFRSVAKNALTHCRDKIHSLVEGFIEVDVMSEFTFGRCGVNDVKKSLKLLQYATPSYWRTKLGEKYFLANVDAIQRGVEVTRIWLQDDKTLFEFRDIIEQQEKAGIKTLLVSSAGVPKELQEDFDIADDQLVAKLNITKEGDSKSERLSVNPLEVQKARNIFDLLLRYASTPDEYYAKNLINREKSA
jgi:hypothetical protein